MINVTQDVINSINSYFNALCKLGYFKYSNVEKLLVYIFIEELLSNKYGIIESEDYRELYTCLECLYGTVCNIPYPENKGKTIINVG